MAHRFSLRNRRFAVSTVFAIAASFMVASGAPAGARSRGSITFRKGTSSKTVSATARRGNPDCWIFSASEGQRVSFRVTGNVLGAILEFEDDPSDGARLQEQLEEFGDRSSARTLVESNRQTLCVAALRSSAAYRLTLTIVQIPNWGVYAP
jgi:hypothetical protein